MILLRTLRRSILALVLDTTDIIIIEMNENRVGAYAYSNGFVEYLNTFLDSYIPIRQEGPVNLDFKDDYYAYVIILKTP